MEIPFVCSDMNHQWSVRWETRRIKKMAKVMPRKVKKMTKVMLEKIKRKAEKKREERKKEEKAWEAGLGPA